MILLIFIDATYYIALLLKNDKHHLRSKKVIVPREQFVINNSVLTEILNMVSKRSSLDVRKVYRDIKENCFIFCLSDDDYLRAMELCAYYNNSINYSDCLILITMENNGINKIVSFDEGFKKIKGLTIFD